MARSSCHLANSGGFPGRQDRNPADANCAQANSEGNQTCMQGSRYASPFGNGTASQVPFVGSQAWTQQQQHGPAHQLLGASQVLLSLTMLMLLSRMATVMPILPPSAMAVRLHLAMAMVMHNLSSFGKSNATQFNNVNAPHYHSNGNASLFGYGNASQFRPW